MTGEPSTSLEAAERAVLGVLLDLHPAPVTRTELRTRLGAGEGAPFAARDQVDVALDELAGYGLLHRHDGWLLVTQPTVHTARLLG